MFNLFKKSEFEIISQKIKNKNHKIIETLNKNEFKEFFKLNEKEQKEKLRKIIEELSGLDFVLVFAYSFHFKDLPMFTYNLHIKKNDYLLVVYGKDDFFGFQCDYFFSENVFRLTLRSNEEIKENEDVFKRLIGEETFNTYVEIAKITKTPTFEVTKKAKKLHQRMISYNYLNEFSYNKFINEL
jgi:alanine-alpha-ketoisovalerate/valine-pyruvate aminotransferase